MIAFNFQETQKENPFSLGEYPIEEINGIEPVALL